MTARLARMLTGLYPRAWRERYAEEFEALLECEEGGLRAFADVFLSAIRERIVPTTRGNMKRHPESFGNVVRQPSALVPMLMSTAALALVMGHIAFIGHVREADEGAIAHLWQLLMALQLPVLAFFAIKWLPRALKPALGVLALQAGAVLAAMAPVLYFNL